METIEGEERWIGKESTGALVAGTIDTCRIGAENRERKSLDDTERDGVHSDERELMQ